MIFRFSLINERTLYVHNALGPSRYIRCTIICTLCTSTYYSHHVYYSTSGVLSFMYILLTSCVLFNIRCIIIHVNITRITWTTQHQVYYHTCTMYILLTSCVLFNIRSTIIHVHTTHIACTIQHHVYYHTCTYYSHYMYYSRSQLYYHTCTYYSHHVYYLTSGVLSYMYILLESHVLLKISGVLSALYILLTSCVLFNMWCTIIHVHTYILLASRVLFNMRCTIIHVHTTRITCITQINQPFLCTTSWDTADFIYKVLEVYTRSMETIYLSLVRTGSWGYLFHEIPGSWGGVQ